MARRVDARSQTADHYVLGFHELSRYARCGCQTV